MRRIIFENITTTGKIANTILAWEKWGDLVETIKEEYSAIFNALQKTPNMHEDSTTVENIIKALFENSEFETTIYILGKLQNYFKELCYAEQRQNGGDEKC